RHLKGRGMPTDRPICPVGPSADRAALDTWRHARTQPDTTDRPRAGAAVRPCAGVPGRPRAGARTAPGRSGVLGVALRGAWLGVGRPRCPGLGLRLRGGLRAGDELLEMAAHRDPTGLVAVHHVPGLVVLDADPLGVVLARDRELGEDVLAG